MKGLGRLPLVLAVAVVVRVPFWVEALRTPVDGDAAIIGLMALHPGQGSTMWGQPYGSPLEAWLAAPLLAALGGRPEGLRLFYFLMGLLLPAVAFFLAREIDERAALPAALLLACPPPYFLLLSALPPPLYPTALLLEGVLLVLTLRLGRSLAEGHEPRNGLALWGVVAGLAAWTHLMTLGAVAVGLVHLVRRAASRRSLLLAAVVPLLAASAPWWWRSLARGEAGILSLSGRRSGFLEHLWEVLPRLHETVGGLLGAQVPLLADEASHVVLAPGWVASALVVVYGGATVLAVRATRWRGPVGLLLAVAAVTVLAFPLPARSHAGAFRFLTPLYLPLAAVVPWVALRSGRRLAAWIAVLALGVLHLLGGQALLRAWRAADRREPPFLLEDLRPLRSFLLSQGIRRAYASYSPAWRLTFESGERIVASQPWNERFLHEPLPLLDEVRFAKDVAWVLTPRVPSGLPSPAEFEAALGAAGGRFRRTEVGGAVVYHGFVPPFAPEVEGPGGEGAAGDGEPGTALVPPPSSPLDVPLSPPRPLAGLTLLASHGGPALPRSLDVEVSGDGAAFEVVARRRRRGERSDLRWVNGHPQYVVDNDLLAVPLGGRKVAVVRLRPVDSAEPWALGELLLHPAGRETRPWEEWLDPGLDWEGRRAALRARPLPGREDWHYRSRLASRRPD